jgi:hypothetical protein
VCPVSQSSTKSSGKEENPREEKKKTWDSQYSYFIDLWLVGSWLRPATPEALLIFLYLIR